MFFRNMEDFHLAEPMKPNRSLNNHKYKKDLLSALLSVTQSKFKF